MEDTILTGRPTTGIGQIRVIPHIYAPEFTLVRRQVRFPRSTKCRIRAKWAKLGRNFRTVPVVAPPFWFDPWTIIVHPNNYERLKKRLDEVIRQAESRPDGSAPNVRSL